MPSTKNTQIIRGISIALILLALALGLAWVQSGFTDLRGWASFGALLLLSSALLWGGWRAISSEGPARWLGGLMIGAALLRLALGIFWLLALPAWGNDNPVTMAGYIMADAYTRDTDAWLLAQSGEPLWQAFRGYSPGDQYGGLLFLSSLIYRFLGAGIHQPLLMIVLTSAVSALAVPFTWAAAQRLWGNKASRLAAWLITLYPEAVLLGSSQMREAFMIPLAMFVLWNIVRAHQTKQRRYLIWSLLALLASLPLSLPFAGALLVLTIITLLALNNWKLLKKPLAWAAIGGLLLVAAALVIYLPEFHEWWLDSAKQQAYISLHASGWVARLFEHMPQWSRIPFLVGYGAFRPLLPAALVADGLPIWRGIAIWRAVGWTALLALVIYASYLALRHSQWKGVIGGLLLVVWTFILIASFRGGGDMWDNPRYRAAFSGVQVSLAAWALALQQRDADPWLRRLIGATAMMVLWFVAWYLRRYTPIATNIVEIWQIVGLGLASGALYAIWDWVRTKHSQD